MVEIRFRRANSAHARLAPCHGFSAIAGRSSMLPTDECIAKKPTMLSNTWSTKDNESRSEIRASPFAADHRTVESYYVHEHRRQASITFGEVNKTLS